MLNTQDKSGQGRSFSRTRGWGGEKPVALEEGPEQTRAGRGPRGFAAPTPSASQASSPQLPPLLLRAQAQV